MSDFASRVFRFHTGAHGDEPLGVFSFRGFEAVSKLYRFEIELASARPDLDLTAMLETPARLELRQFVSAGGRRASASLSLHGVLSSVGQFEKIEDRWIRYRAVLVPRLARLALHDRSRIFLKKSVPGIVAQVLRESGFSEGADFEFRLPQERYPEFEYVVQYQESDLDFLQRLCEHEGVFYFFEHGESAEKIVFADDRERFPAVGGPIEYRPAPESAQDPDRIPAVTEEVVYSLGCWMNMVPAEVVLKEYDWRNPRVDLGVRESVASRAAFGQYYEYGAHYRDLRSGRGYAKIRAEEIRARQKVFRGAGTVKALRAGSTFELARHYRDDFNAAYLVTELTHRGNQTLPLASGTTDTARYSNEFAAIPASVAYRPPRTTARPRVSGVLHAIVDAAPDAEYAEVDAEGRYRVRVPFDLAQRGGAEGSRFIRMAQPYAGGGMGMHFPLHKGTEVILVHSNGDPDRPVIAGAVPNAETTSPVTAANSSHNVIQSASNNQIRMEDTDEAKRIRFYCGGSDSFIEIGKFTQ